MISTEATSELAGWQPDRQGSAPRNPTTVRGHCELIIDPPLGVAWPEQYCVLKIDRPADGQFCGLLVDGQLVPSQLVSSTPAYFEILTRLGFSDRHSRSIALAQSESSRVEPKTTRNSDFDLPISLCGDLTLGWQLNNVDFRLNVSGAQVSSKFICENSRTGPLFNEVCWELKNASRTEYSLRVRWFKQEKIITFKEDFSMEPGSNFHLSAVASGPITHVRTHDVKDFESELPPVEISLTDYKDEEMVLRLQIPAIGEYVIPKNKHWFEVMSGEGHSAFGFLGLNGAAWRSPAENILSVHRTGGGISVRSHLSQGSREWMIVACPDNRENDRGFFDALHADWNACRLDDHLWTSSEAKSFDLEQRLLFLPDNYHSIANEASSRRPELRSIVASGLRFSNLKDLQMNAEDLQTRAFQMRCLLSHDTEACQGLRDNIFLRFNRWIQQFQGYRRGKPDYSKNVIGFSRRLRGLLFDIELLNAQSQLTDEDTQKIKQFLIFAAKRICDCGRWPHKKTFLHPDHPESVRGFYTYKGEQKPDRLVWTNSLPNFQSDPLCALVHLAAMIPNHPESPLWSEMGIEEIERQLDSYCGETGAWEESILYTLYTLSYFYVTFRVIRNSLGIDYFNDSRICRLLDWLTRLSTPLDPRFGEYTFPALGNSVLPTGGGELLLAFALELSSNNPTRPRLIKLGNMLSGSFFPSTDFGPIIAAIAPDAKLEPEATLEDESSIVTDLGVILRDSDSSGCRDSVIFQKIGIFKDHYEADESSINWYAKGVPFISDYGTYTRDAMYAAAHNVLEIADADEMGRGFLAKAHFSPRLDFTQCEIPVIQRLRYGRRRTFSEIDANTEKPRHFYIGDDDQIGPKLWKSRLLLYVKPDYLFVYDSLKGNALNRLNWHVVADSVDIAGHTVHAKGRFGVNLQAWFDSPGGIQISHHLNCPGAHLFGEGEKNPHRQYVLRMEGESPKYRSLLFAGAAQQKPIIRPVSNNIVEVQTELYRDRIVVDEEWQTVNTDDFAFCGRVGWVRTYNDGTIEASVLDGLSISAHGITFTGRGPWIWNANSDSATLLGGPPRSIARSPAIFP